MKCVSVEVQSRHFLIAHFAPHRISGAVQIALYLQPTSRSRAPYQAQDYRIADQRSAPPVLADVREEPVLDLVPLTGSWWQVTHRDRQPCLIG